MTTILLVLAIFGVVIFIHELGHFLVAKLCRVKVKTFSIGFGPTLLSKKLGETEYVLALLPVGGYVSFAGPDHIEDLKPEDSENSRYIVTKPVWQRALIFVAGVTFNFLFAIAIVSGMLYRAGEISIPANTSVIGEVMENLPAAKAGLQKGDKVVAINGVKVNNWNDVHSLLLENKGKPAHFELSRKGQLIYITITPEFNKEANRHLIGVVPGVVSQKVNGVSGAVGLGVKTTGNFTILYAKSVKDLVTGKISSKNLGGPIMIVKHTANVVKQGWGAILQWLFVFNVILGIFNLLPIPVLDGGHLAFLLLETVRRKPLSKKVQLKIMYISFLFIIALVLFATFNDIGRLGK